MCKFKRGDILWGIVSFSDRTGVKPRPVIILNVNPICRYFVVECYSLLDRHASTFGIEIKKNHPNFIECGFDDDTFIHCKNRCWLEEKLLIKHPSKGKPMGFCCFVDEVQECQN